VATLERIAHGQLEAVVLAGDELRASFVPAAGMIGCSLEHRGEELLVQRGGLDAWRGTGKSFGLPLLHPWANRLRDWRYAVAGRAVTIDRSRGVVRSARSQDGPLSPPSDPPSLPPPTARPRPSSARLNSLGTIHILLESP